MNSLSCLVRESAVLTVEGGKENNIDAWTRDKTLTLRTTGLTSISWNIGNQEARLRGAPT